MRTDRPNHTVRDIVFERGFTQYAPGSVLVSFGHTKVLVTASVEDKVPPFLRNSGQGWLTAEYAMLPSSTHSRSLRDGLRGKVSGRTSEIQRLIGRSLRSILDLKLLGERTITIDADVIQADGGTRTAAISGGMLALYDAVQFLMTKGKIKKNPIQTFLAAVSVGIVEGQPMVDLCYEEDSCAEVDMNLVMTESGQFVEIQGSAEQCLFDRTQLDAMLALGEPAISRIISMLKKAVDLV